MKINPWIFCCATALFSVQIALGMFFDNLSLRRELRILEKNKEIANDQINELMYTIGTMKSEKDTISTQQFVAGVVDSLKNKEYYNAIWHDGYNRGENVSKFASEIKPIEFTSEVKK